MHALVTNYLAARPDPALRVLDLGCGRGHMARRIGAWFTERGLPAKDHVIASDIVGDFFEASEIPFQQLDFNRPLPFADGEFDVVFSIEVTEHLHRPYDYIKDCFRILKPGGALIITTPNILHLTSRLRFLFTGFFDLYQPPSVDPANAGRLCGHVMPLHLAYYAYGLRLAGFEKFRLQKDRTKRGSALLTVLLFPLLWITRMRHSASIRKYDAAVFSENRDVLSCVNSFAMFTARSLLFMAEKPAQKSSS